MAMRRLSFGLLLLGASLMAEAEIEYRVTPSPTREKLTVTMAFDVKSATTELQMPSWSPGLYVLENYWTTMKEVTVRDETGRVLAVDHPRGDTWSIATTGVKRVTLSYDRPVPRDRSRLGMFSSDDSTIHYSGPTVYLYVVGRKEEACRVQFDLPEGWKIAVGLDPAGKGARFKAKNYDQLADCPVTMGDFLIETYRARGKEHTLAIRGDAKNKLDRAKAVRMGQFVTDIETDFFGGAPYSRYVWHIWVNDSRDGAGGVEHASSTQIFLATGEGPGALWGMAHEFFHLWNVKRIRSQELGPFDYTKLPNSGALWWLEGVTDYYANYLPFRYSAWGRDVFLKEIASQISTVRRNPARLEVSPYEAGYRIPDPKAGNNSNGYRVSYYASGWMLGMLFDIEIRTRTKGKRSLDDVERALWKLCQNDRPGFEDGEIRRQLIRFGGPEMGALYDQWVTKPGELPIEDVLGKVGLSYTAKDGVSIKPDITPEQRRTLDQWLQQRPNASPLR